MFLIETILILITLNFPVQIIAGSPEETTCIAAVDDGLVVGSNGLSVNGKRICKYLGLPYALPPIGNLRFEPPVMLKWTGIQNFVEKPEMCPQPINLEKGDDTTIKGNEDCLTLSVYTPLQLNSSKLLPVFFWIHGGRPLGFLSIPRLNITGNLGLKDQVMALQWVQRNIASFGGNPRKVTLVSWSAGASSATYHMYSKQSKGLFNRVIAMSGTILNPWAFLERPDFCGNNFLEFTGFQTKNELKNASVFQLMPRLREKLMFSYFGQYHFCFIPTIEPVWVNHRFLKKSPIRLVKSPPVNNVTLMIGYTNLESEILYPSINYFMSNFNYANKNETYSEIIQDYIQNFLDDNFQSDDEQRRVLLRLATIADTFYGIREFIQYYSKNSKSRIYAYQFSFDGHFGHFKRTANKKYRHISGAVHGDELGYLFVPFFEDISGHRFDSNSKEIVMSKRMVEMWTNFVKYGNPTPILTDLIQTKWKPYNESMEVLNIDNVLQMQQDPFTKNYLYEFWNEIYRCLHKFKCEIFNNRTLTANQ
uniref:carboxylesterase n=1 Tax=Culicoides sonorensis TaxID=179676 RepID=A0A336K0Z1_CULSO